MTSKFTWVPIYRELANRLVDQEAHQGELLALLEQIRADGITVTPLNDQGDQGAHFPMKEIDPFTFYGTFNRGIRKDQRLGILAALKKHFGLQSKLPEDFDGIPILNNLRSWFIAYQYSRKTDDVARLWRVFRLALAEKPWDNPEFLEAFDKALEVACTNLNLTMGLFWIRPEYFLNLDHTNRQYLKIKLPSSGLSAEFYRKTVESTRSKGKTFVELSYQAWLKMDDPDNKNGKLPEENSYWLVGAYWSDNDPQDQTDRFLAEGIWENGYTDRYLDEVRTMKVGDKIAIKAAFTQKKNLPFDAQGRTASCMVIKAIGTVAANRGDGRTVEVEWDSSFKPKTWYFYTSQNTVWQLQRDSDNAGKLIDFVFGSDVQDYKWFIEQSWGAKGSTSVTKTKSEEPQPYSVEDMVAVGVFLEETELRQALESLESKKNLILQGPPGVGKTYIARKLAYALMEETDDRRIEFVQFHQSYSYEDFVQGYRPLPDDAGAFGLRDGVFFEFCKRAKEAEPNRFHVFIVDEINRGNLSQIFGELLMLIEADKRGPNHAVPLVYRRADDPRFFVPENVFLIGLMNLADRSLALVDYALRRRFAFLTLTPKYNDRFRNWLLERKMDGGLVELVVARMGLLNQEIAADPLLGENYQIGHSFFCPKGNDFTALNRSWYDRIVSTEIVPLLKEYWFDNSKRAGELAKTLLAP